MNKIPIEEVAKFTPYSEDNPDYGYVNGPGYEGLVTSLGVEIVLEESDGDYQGDSYLVLKDEPRWGLLTFGWGSCSGCDSYEGCDSVSDMSDLRDFLEGAIRWFDTLDGLKTYITTPGIFESWREEAYPDGAVATFRRKVAEL